MKVPWMTCAGLLCVALERRWERRTRQEMGEAAVGPLPPLMGRWLSRASVTRAAAARVYRRHFETEIEMSRRFADTALVVLALADVTTSSNRSRLLAASTLAVLPFTKLLAKPQFNEVEAALPVVGPLSLLREEEVVWGLAAETAAEPALAPWDECAARLPMLPVPSRARAVAGALPLEVAAADDFRIREEHCRRDRLRVQRRALRWLLAAALAGAVLSR